MTSTFVDTGVWYAYANASDNYHERAVALFHGGDSPLLTTWPVVWESITLVSRELGGEQAAQFGKELISETWVRILELTGTDHVLALEVLPRFANLRISAADATSCAIIRRLNIPDVATLDRHFRIVVPERRIIGID